MQVQTKLSRISMLLIAACLSACATQTERGSSGAGAQGRTVAPSTEPKTAEPAQPPAQWQPPAEQQEGTAKEDGITAHSQYHEEEEGAAKDDGITAQSRYHEEEEGAAKDDGITAQSRYHEEEEGAAKDDGITAQSRYHEEQGGAAKDDGITAQSQYHDEEAGAKTQEDILAHNVYGGDDSGKAPEEHVGQPKTYSADEVDQAEAASEEPERQPQAHTEVAEAEQPRPATVLPVTVTVETNPLFDFDKAAMRSDAKTKLDSLIQQLDGIPYGDIVAVGFTDPIGAAMYNNNLSERRALSVKAYLVSRGISADKIRVEGRGETEEYASYEGCGGLRKQKLITCLQPDRRVEVTVTAQKVQ